MKFPELRKFLRDQNMTYEDLAKILEISPQAVYRRMSGQVKWTLQDAVRFCKYFGAVDIQEIFKVYD